MKEVYYWVVLKNEWGHVIHKQEIAANELHLIATFFKEHADLNYIQIWREERV